MDAASASSDAFTQLLHKLSSIDPLQENDVDRIDRITRTSSISEPSREEQPLPRLGDCPFLAEQLGPMFDSLESGLKSTGYVQFPTRTLGAGAFGSVTLGMKIRDGALKPDRRHLCGIKVQSSADVRSVWAEISVLRCCAHPNIIGYFDHFLVGKSQSTSESSSRRPPPLPKLYLIIEFADAATLKKEMKRFPDKRMPEEAIRYYVKQVNRGLDYLHHRRVTHNDMHLKNVLLKFLPSRGKKCLITDFGRALLHSTTALIQDDVIWWLDSVAILMNFGTSDYLTAPDLASKLAGLRSKECLDFLNLIRRGELNVRSISEAESTIPWFKGPEVAPLPIKSQQILAHQKQQQQKRSVSAEGFFRTTSPNISAAQVFEERKKARTHARHSSLPVGPTRFTAENYPIPEESQTFKDLPHLSRPQSRPSHSRTRSAQYPTYTRIVIPQTRSASAGHLNPAVRESESASQQTDNPNPAPVLQELPAEAAADGAVVGRESVRARVRRSLSSIGQWGSRRVRNLNCFRRRDSPNDASVPYQNIPGAGPSGAQLPLPAPGPGPSAGVPSARTRRS